MASPDHVEPAWKRLPSFIQPLDKLRFDEDDLQYLAHKNVFDLLPEPLAKATISRYAEFVHPMAPAFDIGEVLNIMSGSSKKQMPLLLYHAMMTAGLRSVDDDILLDHGFGSKSEARDVCYQKAKLLYDMDTRADRSLLCIAAMLFITWGGLDNRKDAFFWAGAAVNEALAMNLNRQLLSATAVTSSSQARLWWIVVMREVDVCLSLGKLPRLKIEGLRELALLDLAPNRAPFDSAATAPKDHFVAKMIQLLCFKKVQLSLIAIEVLQVRFDCFGNALPAAQVPTILSRLDAKLHEWFTDLTKTLPLLGETDSTVLTEANRALLTNTAQVALSAWLAVITLHKTGVAFFAKRNHMLVRKHVQAVENAAVRALKIFQALYDNKLMIFVPASSVGTLCAVVYALTTAKASHNGAPERTEAIKDHLQACLLYFDALADMNYMAQQVADTARATIISASMDRQPQSNQVVPEESITTSNADAEMSFEPLPELDNAGDDMSPDLNINFIADDLDLDGDDLRANFPTSQDEFLAWQEVLSF